MEKYDKLVKALRRCDMKQGCFNANCQYSVGKYFCDMDKVHKDAAAAIEALNRLVDLNTERCEGLREQLRKAQEQYEKHLNELEQQLPKRGEWIEENRRPRSSQFVCSVCHRTAYAPQPTRDKEWRKRCRYAYCPNCGAKMVEGTGRSNLSMEQEGR